MSSIPGLNNWNFGKYSISTPTLLAHAKQMGFNIGMYSSNENSKAMEQADYKYIGPYNDKETFKNVC